MDTELTGYEPVTIADPRLDDKKFIFEGIDVTREPLFTVSEIAKFFFGRSAHWVRWQEGQGHFTLTKDGEKVPVGDRRTESGARVYALSDVEDIAHALAEHQAINGRQLNDVMLILSTNARIWGYL
jgi:hypothetical protein